MLGSDSCKGHRVLCICQNRYHSQKNKNTRDELSNSQSFSEGNKRLLKLHNRCKMGHWPPAEYDVSITGTMSREKLCTVATEKTWPPVEALTESREVWSGHRCVCLPLKSFCDVECWFIWLGMSHICDW